MPNPATHEDARLLLELYNLRREKVLRRARDFVQQDCKFKNFKDFTKKYPEGSKKATYVGMVLGYWDLACTLVNKGLINQDLFNSTTFEHVGVWVKLKPLVEAWREAYSYPGIAAALEAVAGAHPAAPSSQHTEAEAGKGAKKKKKKKKGK
jgi:hypothetical protein